ncbi:MAG: hypothetical protein U5K69_03160 [Balneolaceae bacterium]|nr:hypothetical protein [Balneolaceae bacterium]
MLILTACDLSKDEDSCLYLPCSDDPEQEIQEALINIEDGREIALGEGTFDFSRTLTMEGKSGMTIQGRGRDKTFLSFRNQISGGDGLLISNSENIVVRDLTILDARGTPSKSKTARVSCFMR